MIQIALIDILGGYQRLAEGGGGWLLALRTRRSLFIYL